MHSIMLVDDESNILNALKRVLKHGDWSVEIYTSASDALKRAQTNNFDLFISDYRMPNMNGVEFLSAIKELQPESIRIILSGFADLESMIGAINKAGIFRFVSKPWEDYELITTVEQALKHRDILLENRILADQVRQQEQELDRRKSALDFYKHKHPELMEVNWNDDGSIVFNEGET